MKTSNMKQSIGAIALVGVLLSPALSFAVGEPVYDQQVESAVNNQLNNTNSKLDSVSTGVNSVQLSTSDILKFMSQSASGSPYTSMDQISAKYVQALINYDAAARLNAYQYDQQLLFMKAPGSESAIKAGALVGSTNVNAAALQISNLSYLSAIAPFSNAKNFTGPLAGGTSVTIAPLDKVKLYDDNFKSFVADGNTAGLTIVNPSQFIQSDNLVKSGLNTQSQQMIDILTNAPPIIDASLMAQIQKGAGGGDPDGGGKEQIVDALAEYAILSVSKNALADVISIRTPGKDSNGNELPQSAMEALVQFNNEHFGNKEFFTSLSTASPAALARVNAQINSALYDLMLRMYKVQEKQLVLLATMNTMQAKMNMQMDKLNSQIQSAQAQAAKAQSDYKAAASSCKAGQILDANGNCMDYQPPETPKQ